MTARLPIRQPEVTDRQFEVARLVAAGYTNERIAEALGISLAGAKYHVSELLTRLGLERREQIAEWYQRERSVRPRLRAVLAAFISGRRVVSLTVALGVIAAAVVLLSAGRERLLPGGNAAGGPPEVVEGYRTYTAQELQARGMEDLGRLFIANGHIEAQIRVDLVAVRLPGESRIDLDNGVTRWLELGCCGTLNLRGADGEAVVSVYRDVYGDQQLGYVRRGLGEFIVEPGQRRARPEVAVDLRTGQPPAGHYLEVAVDQRGHLFVGRVAEVSGAYELFTRERLDTMARALGRVGTPTRGHVDAATYCVDRDECEAVYRGEELLAPIAGELRCAADGGLELRSDDLALHFSRSGVCPEGLPRRVSVGEVILDRTVATTISGAAADGSAVPVAIGDDGTLYAGGITPTLGCPCRQYR